MKAKTKMKIAKNNFRELNAQFRALEDNDSNRKFELSFSSEEPYERWFGAEILDHSDGAVDLTRLQEIGVTLFNHNRDYVLGKILRVWMENGKGYAEIEFDSDEESEKIFQKVKNGTLKGVSVGYIVNVYEEVKAGSKSSDGRFSGPCYIATSWTPYEISVVSVPADATVGVGREFDEQPAIINYTKEKSQSLMSIEDVTIQINQNKSL